MIQARPKPVYLCWAVLVVLCYQLHACSPFTLGVGRLQTPSPKPSLPAVLLVCPSSEGPWWETVELPGKRKTHIGMPVVGTAVAEVTSGHGL